MVSKEEALTPEQAAVYVAVHGFELWYDRRDKQLPWAVERDNWAQWDWARTLTTRQLDGAIHTAFHDSPGRPDKWVLDALGVSIIHVPLPTTPQPALRV